jgi:AroM protein.
VVWKEESGVTKKVGAVTIGQSPRVDVVPEMCAILGPDIEIVEGGALDGLSAEEIAALAPRAGEYVLVTKLNDGRSVTIGKEYIIPRLQAQIDRLVNAGAEGILLLCTGNLPPFACSKMVLSPQVILQHFVAGVAAGRRLGVITPDPAQVERTLGRWTANHDGPVRVVPASPYGREDHVDTAALALKAWHPDLIVLDCIGFDQAMKQAVARLTGVPVVLPRNVVARTLAELFA